MKKVSEKDTRILNIKDRLHHLQNLEVGWNGYYGIPVSSEVADFALSLLKELMNDNTPIPEIVPSSSGGVQIEWHQNGIEIEINIDKPNEIGYYVHSYSLDSTKYLYMSLEDIIDRELN